MKNSSLCHDCLKVKYLVLGSIHQITPSPRKKREFLSRAKILQIQKIHPPFLQKNSSKCWNQPPPPSTKKLHLIEVKDFVFQIFIYAIIQTKLIESIKLILGNLNVERFFFFFFSPFLLVKTVKGFNFLPFKKKSPPRSSVRSRSDTNGNKLREKQ